MFYVVATLLHGVTGLFQILSYNFVCLGLSALSSMTGTFLVKTVMAVLVEVLILLHLR